MADAVTRKTKQPRDRSKSWDVPIIVLLVLGLLAIGLSIAGWLLVLPTENDWLRWEQAIYRSLSVNTLSEQYDELFGNSDLKDNFAGLLMLTIAKWLGALVFFLTLAKVVIALFAENVLSFVCWWSWKGHVVVIGDDDFGHEVAADAAEIRVARKWWGIKLGERHLNVVHFKPGGRETTRDGILTLDSDVGLRAMLKASAAHRARSIVFAFKENAASIERAREAFTSPVLREKARGHSLTSQQGPQIFAYVSDGWYESRESLEIEFSHPEGTQGNPLEGKLDSVVELVSESRCAARSVLAAFPLHTLQSYPVQHVLLVGLGAMGEATLVEICETQRVDPNRRQKITIVDPDKSVWDRFKRRCPEWDKVFDGAFIASDMLENGFLSPEIRRRIAEAPLAAAFIATGENYDPALAAANLKEAVECEVEARHLLESHAEFHIFTCVRGGSATLSPAMWEKAKDKSGMPVIAFGAWGDIITAARVLDDEPDERAFAIHKVNSKLHGGGAPVPDWSSVSETDRYSSRSAAAFIPTLLHAARIDLSDWRLSNDTRPPSLNRPPRLSESMLNEIDLFDRLHLARLEHIRYCAERRLRGFRYDKVRDKARKRHPSLVPFDALASEEQSKSLSYIDALLETLRPGKGETASELKRTLSGGRPAVRPSDIDLLRRAGRLGTQAVAAGQGKGAPDV